MVKGLSKKKAVKGIIGELDLGEGPFLTLDMPRHPDEARMSFNLEAILRHEFFGKAVLIVEDYEEKIPIDPKKLNLILADQLAKDIGVV